MHQLTLSQFPADVGIVGTVSHITMVALLANCNTEHMAAERLHHISAYTTGGFHIIRYVFSLQDSPSAAHVQ